MYCMRTLTRYSRINHMDNALHHMCYMCIQWTRVLYSVVITWQSNSTISQFNSPCNDSRVSGQCLYTIYVIQFIWVISYTQTLHYGQITRIASNVFIISFSYKIFLKRLTNTNMYVCWLIPIPVSTIVKQAILLMALHSNTFLEPTSSDKYG